MVSTTVTLNNGIIMPAIGFGTWPLKGNEALQAVENAINTGYRLIDTAARYENEQDIRKSLKQLPIDREQLFVTSKLRGSQHGYKQTIEAFHQSLARLGLDYLDLYLIHWPIPSKNLYVESWKALITLRNQGLIRAIGVSNFKIAHLSRIIDETGVIPAVNQIQLDPTFPQNELQQWCDRYQITCQSWSPLGRGSILSKPLIQAIAQKHQKSPAQIILRWHLQRKLTVIPKSTNITRMTENINIFNFELSAQDMIMLNTLESNKQPTLDPDKHIEE